MIIPINKKRILIVAILAAIVVAIGLGFYFGFKTKAEDNIDEKYIGAVVANGIECAAIGSAILKRNGTAADAAIATLFCEGVACPQSMGLGGGFLLTIYTKETGVIETLDAREAAPLRATPDMFVNSSVSSSVGGMSIAVPGELKGYWALHERYGNLPWSELIKPTIELCRKGHLVSPYLARILASRESQILEIESLREVFIDPATSHTWKQGDYIKRLKLADTLEIIAEEGVNGLYNGTLTESLLNDITNFGGIITKEDLNSYQPRWEKPVTANLINNNTLYTSPLPGSGVVLTFMLNILNGFITDQSSTTWHRIIESFKFGYAKRTDLGDMLFEPSVVNVFANLTNPTYIDYIRKLIDDEKTYNDYAHYGANFSNAEDHGTAHISVLAPNGDAVAVTSTVNYILGSMRRSQSTGIILNDEMDDFSTPGTTNVYGIPASPANFIKPEKRPMSSMCPTIIVNGDGDVQMIIGGAGGSKITTSVAYAIIRYLYFNETLKEAIVAKRIHHQLAPMVVQHETGFNQVILKDLIRKGHELEAVLPDSGFAALVAISVDADGYISTMFDPRRGGSEIKF